MTDKQGAGCSNFFGQAVAAVIFFVLTMVISSALGVPKVVGFILACILAVGVAILIASVFVAADKSGEKAFRSGSGTASWLRSKSGRIMTAECNPVDEQLKNEEYDLPSKLSNLANWLGTPEAEYQEQAPNSPDWNEAIDALRASIPQKHAELVPAMERVALCRKQLYTSMSEWRAALPKVGRITKSKHSRGEQARFEILMSYTEALAKLEAGSPEREAFEVAAKALFASVQDKMQAYRDSWAELIGQYEQRTTGTTPAKDSEQEN